MKHLISVFSLCIILGLSNFTSSESIPSAFEDLHTISSNRSRSFHRTNNQLVSSNIIYLPYIIQSDTFYKIPAIWTHNSLPAEHEVALFRHTFPVENQLENAGLHIFADTRYEVWIDGRWIGRGPSRFSRELYEYDVYNLNSLNEGSHLISVLVQWAPNTRRSESVMPHLKLSFQGILPDGSILKQETSSNWKVMLSNAWRSDAAPVHAWNLIGPTEILNFDHLPETWNQPGYNDEHWDSAVIQDIFEATKNQINSPLQKLTNYVPDNQEQIPQLISSPINDPFKAIYQPRSIPFPDRVPVPISVIDGGLLSPGFQFEEIERTLSGAADYYFTVNRSTDIRLEILEETLLSETSEVLLDGNPIHWGKVSELRPDVYASISKVDSGTHQLSFVNTPQFGVTIAISKANLEFDSNPFRQGNHAGRRMLLANPTSDLDKFEFSSVNGVDSYSLLFYEAPGYVILDLGRTINGRLTADISGSEGSIIDIGWDERLLENTSRPLPYPGTLHPEWNQVDSWLLDGSTRNISTIDSRSGRYIQIAVWGTGPIEITNMIVFEDHYPLPQLGDFQSSDTQLNHIWQIGVDTTYLNMSDAYTDTPWRERGQWWGDAYVADHINRVAIGDTAILRRGILFMANAFSDGYAPGAAPNINGTNMLDYAMLWVHSLAEYTNQTGDIDLLLDEFVVLKSFLLQLDDYENNDSGLLDIPRGDWWQTAYIGTYGVDSRYGQSTALNSIYYSTLLQAAVMADLIGDETNSQIWRNKAYRVREMLNTVLYLPDEHRYLTNFSVENDEIVVAPPTPQAQAWALTYGIVPDGEIDQVVDALHDLLPPDPTNQTTISIYGMFWVLDGLGRTGHIQEAVDIIKNYYGHIVDLDATSWWERFNANSDFRASLSHAWGGTPTWFLTTYVLGAQQTGANTWIVRPAIYVLPQASGTIPISGSLLEVSWEIDAFHNRNISIRSDPSTNGEIVVPYPTPTEQIVLNGKIIWDGGQALVDNAYEKNDAVYIQISGGNHSLQIRSLTLQ